MTAMKRVLKWNVPVDDHDHPIGGGPVVHVGCQTGVVDVVQVWTEEPVPGVRGQRRVRVYGTGQPIPEGDVHIGSVIAPVTPPKTLVWHVYGGA